MVWYVTNNVSGRVEIPEKSVTSQMPTERFFENKNGRINNEYI